MCRLFPTLSIYPLVTTAATLPLLPRLLLASRASISAVLGCFALNSWNLRQFVGGGEWKSKKVRGVKCCVSEPRRFGVLLRSRVGMLVMSSVELNGLLWLAAFVWGIGLCVVFGPPVLPPETRRAAEMFRCTIVKWQVMTWRSADLYFTAARYQIIEGMYLPKVIYSNYWMR